MSTDLLWLIKVFNLLHLSQVFTSGKTHAFDMSSCIWINNVSPLKINSIYGGIRMIAQMPPKEEDKDDYNFLVERNKVSKRETLVGEISQHKGKPQYWNND